jgi:hypothetical protein
MLLTIVLGGTMYHLARCKQCLVIRLVAEISPLQYEFLRVAGQSMFLSFVGCCERNEQLNPKEFSPPRIRLSRTGGLPVTRRRRSTCICKFWGSSAGQPSNMIDKTASLSSAVIRRRTLKKLTAWLRACDLDSAELRPSRVNNRSGSGGKYSRR